MGQNTFSKNNIEILKIFDIKPQKRKWNKIAWEWKDKNGIWKKENRKWSKQQKKSNNTGVSDTENSDESLDKMEEAYRERSMFFKNLAEQLNELKNSLLGTEEKSKDSK